MIRCGKDESYLKHEEKCQAGWHFSFVAKRLLGFSEEFYMENRF